MLATSRICRSEPLLDALGNVLVGVQGAANIAAVGNVNLQNGMQVVGGVLGGAQLKGAANAAKAEQVAAQSAESAASVVPNVRQILYHYTDETGLNGILKDNSIRPSLKELSPKDVRYGNGQYFTDIPPGTKTPGELSYALLKHPFSPNKFTHFVAIDVTGLNVVRGREGVYVISSDVNLDIGGRIEDFGIVLDL